MTARVGIPIATERILAVRPSGERLDVMAGVGTPYTVGPNEWACPVSLSGLHDQLSDVHGGSSLQALCLAASLLRQLLTYFVEDGGTLLHPATDEPFDVGACFSRVGRHELTDETSP
jgi:hypothetical protein